MRDFRSFYPIKHRDPVGSRRSKLALPLRISNVGRISSSEFNFLHNISKRRLQIFFPMNRNPGILFFLLKISQLLLPIGSTTRPQIEVNFKILALIEFQSIDVKTHLFGRNWSPIFSTLKLDAISPKAACRRRPMVQQFRRNLHLPKEAIREKPRRRVEGEDMVNQQRTPEDRPRRPPPLSCLLCLDVQTSPEPYMLP